MSIRTWRTPVPLITKTMIPLIVIPPSRIIIFIIVAHAMSILIDTVKRPILFLFIRIRILGLYGLS